MGGVPVLPIDIDEVPAEDPRPCPIDACSSIGSIQEGIPPLIIGAGNQTGDESTLGGLGQGAMMATLAFQCRKSF